MDDKQYILDRVLVDSNTGCWLWQQQLDQDGYGRVGGPRAKRFRKQCAHQISYILYHGPIPDGLLVRHKCRSTNCCNPDHLEVGTIQDNMMDKYRDSTNLLGSANVQAKLIEDQVVQIRTMYSTGLYSFAKLAKQFDVSAPAIHQIISRKTWTHI